MKEMDESEDWKSQFHSDLVPVEWDLEKQARAKALIDGSDVQSARFASIPMTCRGDKCPSKRVCPLFQENLHPLKGVCPIEAKFVAELSIRLIEEMDIDPNSINEVGMVRDLVDQEIQQIRKQNVLATEDFIQENVVGLDESGAPILKKEMHQAVILEDKLHKRKAALLKQLVATRESRFKAGATVASDAVTMAKAVAEYQRHAAQATQDELAALGYSSDSGDAYIEAQEKLKEQEDD